MIPRKTKIICTIGPSSQGVDNLVKLIEAGMNAARLNFSHSTHEIHLQTIKDIQEASRITGKPAAIIQDLQGPKIRTGKVPDEGVMLEDGQKFVITGDPMETGNKDKVSTTYSELVKEAKPGSQLLLDDGYIILYIKAIERNDIVTEVIKGGLLRSNKGIIAPGTPISAPSLSRKDIEDLKFGLEAGVDIVALSFVRSERDVLELKTTMKIFGRVVPVISKIERFEGYEDLDDIVEESEAIMVARGDLGLEMPAEQVPVLQKQIIRKCNQNSKAVITATQMLESMINNPRPTRAEASDVANAVLDGTDCVMLSGETSMGRYPFEAVGYMDRIIRYAETNPVAAQIQKIVPEKIPNIDDALGRASCIIADQISASAIIPITRTGYTAMHISKYRPVIPIIAITQSPETQKLLSIVWGVESVLAEENLTTDEIIAAYKNYLEKFDFIKTGDNIVFVAGLSAGKVHAQNMIKIIQA